MLISLEVSNCFVFQKQVTISMKADLVNKRLNSNVIEETGDVPALIKTAAIYGPNNVGKSCLIKSAQLLKSIILGQPVNLGIVRNLFTKDKVCELGVVFSLDSRVFSYKVRFIPGGDKVQTRYVFEELKKLHSFNSNKADQLLFVRDKEKNIFDSPSERIRSLLNVSSENIIFVNNFDEKQVPEIKEAKEALLCFANSIDIIDLNNAPMGKTINILKDEKASHKEIVDFIKQADLDLDDIRYNKDCVIHLNGAADNAIPTQVEDVLKLESSYRGVKIPSVINSEGTQKVFALSSYIIDAIKNGRILFVDELDSSLHFKLTRAFVSLFNNIANNKAQLIFTTQDISLLDCNRLMRKEQIIFLDKSRTDGPRIISLNDFTSRQGVRGDTSDIINLYKRGVFGEGTIPNPDFIDTLLRLIPQKEE